MKMIKILDPIINILGIIFVLLLFVQFSGLFPEYNVEIIKTISDIIFAFFAFCLALTNYQCRHLYKIRDTQYDAASITIDNLNETIKHRDNEIIELNDMIQDIQLRIEDERDLMYRAEKVGKPVAITADNSIYFSFVVKKEGGLIVTRKERNKPEKEAKTEKVAANLGISIDSIVYIFENGKLRSFDPLNMLPKNCNPGVCSAPAGEPFENNKE
jgi:hypothetical protein